MAADTQVPSLCLINANSLEEILNTAVLAEEIRAQIVHSYSQLTLQREKLQLQVQLSEREKLGLRQDLEKLVEVLKRRGGTYGEKALIVREREEKPGLDVVARLKNEQLQREIQELRAEITALRTQIRFLSMKSETAEAENKDLQAKLVSFQSTPQVFPTHLPPPSPKPSVHSSSFAANEATRLLKSLEAEKAVVLAYKAQNLTLKESRSELISHCQTLLSTAESLQKQLIMMEEEYRNAQFSACLWKMQFESLESVFLREVERKRRLASALEAKIWDLTIKDEGMRRLVEQLKASEAAPAAPLLEPNRPLPQSFPMIAEPPLGMLDQLARAQQEIVSLTEKCSRLESSSSQLLSQALIQLTTVLYRWKKAVGR